jgi:hypothetical protein
VARTTFAHPLPSYVSHLVTCNATEKSDEKADYTLDDVCVCNCGSSHYVALGKEEIQHSTHLFFPQLRIQDQHARVRKRHQGASVDVVAAEEILRNQKSETLKRKLGRRRLFWAPFYGLDAMMNSCQAIPADVEKRVYTGP